jgi:hypothetical protein
MSPTLQPPSALGSDDLGGCGSAIAATPQCVLVVLAGAAFDYSGQSVRDGGRHCEQRADRGKYQEQRSLRRIESVLAERDPFCSRRVSDCGEDEKCGNAATREDKSDKAPELTRSRQSVKS